MPVISLRQFGDIGKIAGDAGKSITGVAGQAAGGASQAVEQTKQVTDSVGDVANLAGQVKDLTAATQEAIAFIGMCYEFYLSYKWAFQLLLIFIILIFIMEKMCCVFLWIQFFAKCCCFPVTCGLWLIKHGCCTKIGRCCVSCKELVPDLDEKEKRAADTGLKWNGCDTTYLTTCCGAIKLPDDPERAQAWRLSTMISKVVPCVPASWSDVKKHGDFIGKTAYRELRSRAKSAQGGVRRRMGRDWRKDARLLGVNRYGDKGKQQSTDDGDESQSEGVVDIDEKSRTNQRSKSSKSKHGMV